MPFARVLALWLAALSTLAPTTAFAGRRPYMWVWDTEIVPEGDLELEQWLWARSRSPDDPSRPAAYWIWWAPVIGISPHLEVALPFQLAANAGATRLDSFEVDSRIRLLPRGDERPLQALLRAVCHWAIQSAEPSRIDLNLVGSYQLQSGVRLNVDVGAALGVPALRGQQGALRPMLTYAAGASFPVADGALRLSAELFGESPISIAGATVRPHLFLGPAISWTRGRMWLTAGSLVGLTPLFPNTPHLMPRLIWAVVL